MSLLPQRKATRPSSPLRGCMCWGCVAPAIQAVEKATAPALINPFKLPITSVPTHSCDVSFCSGRKISRCALRGGGGDTQHTNGGSLRVVPGWPQALPLPLDQTGSPQGIPGPARCPNGMGRASLPSIVFLNAFMNNSKRKYYSLAGSQGPAWCCGAGPGAAKANMLPVPPLPLSPVFPIDCCPSLRAPQPLPSIMGTWTCCF